MRQALPKNFDFKEAEPRLYERWEKEGYFKPEVAPPDAEPFVIAIPPPNVTGSLHIGHAIFVALQDIMIRHARMRGKAALWIPGMDHASIATQLQVEKLLTSEGVTREQIGREKFLERAWAWKNEYGGKIVYQLRSMGASCDWERERFTMDEGFSDAVIEAFIRLYDQGLIYRGPRLVNWSPGLKTAVSDLEVERTEEIGKLYFFRYPVEGGGFIPVATTRPETILGDTAVAVHPDDPRYQQYIGRNALVPMLNRPIPIVADTYVDSSFGTGALKVTPGHDFNDYQIAQRHNLPILSIMNRDATINEHGGKYTGLDRFVCREQLWADMTAAGLTIEVRDHPMVVPRAERGGEVIEPMISEQWFVRIAPLAEKAAQVVRDGRIRIVPERFEKVYFHWLDNIEDWCISRQLWWGHRIPVWYGSDGSRVVSKTPPPPRDGITYTQDEDVLDTWFSSGLWPFATLGWYHDTPDLRRYYPTDILETGYDILFFWVVRMVMFGLWFTDDIPFHTVYLHGLIRDKLGRKISKTLGNVIDPLEYMDKYGADPLRFTLVTSGTPGNDINLDTEKIERNWRFVNKIWQMSSFTLSNLGETVQHGAPDPAELDLPARWIMSRLHHVIESVERLFESHLYGEAGRQIDDFLWTEFADWFIEISKHPLYQGTDAEKAAAQRVLLTVLDTSLRLLHPFMPFVTEELWSYLPHPEGEDRPLILAAFPEHDPRYFDAAAEEEMSRLIELVRGIRNVRGQYNVEPGRRITALIQPGDHTAALESCGYIFSRLCNVGEYQLLNTTAPAPDKAAVVVSGDITVYLPLADFIDAAAECARLDQELQKIGEQIARTEAMLSNEQFVSRARPDVVERERARLSDLQASAAQIRERIHLLCQN
jgi:valyl-tRNA synthetase